MRSRIRLRSNSASAPNTWNTRRPPAGAGVDVLLQAAQSHLGGFETFHQLDEVLERAAQTVQPPNDDGITGTQYVHERGQTDAIRLGAAHRILENALASCSLQSIPLQVEVLVISRYPSVANQHGDKSNKSRISSLDGV